MRIFHLKWPRFKHEENSIRGILRAKFLHFDAIDIDMQITRDGVVIGCHWLLLMLRDGFRDPKKLISPTKPVNELTWAVVQRFVAGRRPLLYRVQRIETLLRWCARIGITAVLEPKGDKRFETDGPWQHIAKVADDVGCHVRVYALPTHAAALPYARRAGFLAKTIGTNEPWH